MIALIAVVMGSLDENETCDPLAAGGCPSSCDDVDLCTSDTLIGTADACNAECVFAPIVECSLETDGCCAPGCNSLDDGDCARKLWQRRGRRR